MHERSVTSLARFLPGWAPRVTVALLAALASIAPAAAQTSALRLRVVSATDGTPIAAYKYLLNVDNTGQTLQRTPADGCSPASPGYPGSCLWTSIAGAASTSPIHTQGDQADFGGTSSLTLPDGRYLVSVLADGFKLDGEHFAVPLDPARFPGGVVTVRMQPAPLPAAIIQAAVFEDISPVNGAPDLPAEHGLAGFQGHIADYLGEVTTDVFGNPLCTSYDAGGNPIAGSGGRCLSRCYVVSGGVDVGTVAPSDGAGRCPSDGTGLTMESGQPVPAGAAIEGKVKIPNLGPNRYALSVTPPDGRGWVQTTTLEGNLDWDAWVMEGATGLDTEFVVAGEPFPAIIFGYVPAGLNTLASGGGSITGVVSAVKVYVPTVGGIGGLPGTIWGGLSGAKLDRPVDSPWVALTDLINGDTAVWVGQGDGDGKFTIPGVPAGNYTLTWWDADLNYILDLVNVTVGAGEAVDLGVLPSTGWWTRLEGTVFNDLNRNGIRDDGEPGVPNYTLTIRKRENSLLDRGGTSVTTDQTGRWVIENAYPMTQWLVLEAYNDAYYTTGVTYQSDNQPTPTTVLGAGVDVSFHPVIGLAGTIDWGVHSYQPFSGDEADPMNGGIVGTVSYDTTRNELDPRYAAVEDWQPGIPGLTVELYAPVDCPTPVPAGTICSTGFPRYVLASDGAYRRGPLLNTYVTETWQRPGPANGDGVCVPRNVDGNPLAYPADQQVTASETDCLEGPLMGVQFQKGFSTVDGNYGFGEGCFTGVLDATDPAAPVCSGGAFEPLPGGRDYLVRVVIPDDATGRPLYKVTREEDINIANGDVFVPAVPPPACAGSLHTVDVAGILPDGFGPTTLANGVVVPASTPTDNPTFVDIGGSPFEGQPKPLCDVKLVPLANGKSIVPTFNLFTDVPIPGRFWGLIVDDLNFSSNPRSLNFGEKAGVPFAPVGIYDYTNRLITTVESDYNGLFDVLLPSTNRISCPTPSGVCANLYRLVGNDPGVPGRLNANYKPEFRTIAAEFEALPGLLVPADLAPTQVGVTVQLPGGQVNQVSCALDPATPQLFAVDRPWVQRAGNAAARTFTILGDGFGATRGSGGVTLDGVPLTIGAGGWSNTQITATVPNTGTGAVPAGPHQLVITAGNGQRTVNGLTIHVLGSGGGATYNPNLYEVGPGRSFAPVNSLPAAADHAIQRALDAAAASPGMDLVVVYPNDASADPRQNPRGAYHENLILTRPVKLQGVGPGGVRADGTTVRGSILDGGAFAGDSPVAADWYTRINALTWRGNQAVNDGAVISIYATDAAGGAFPTAFSALTAPSIDGLDLRGGDQQGFPGNINPIGGGPTGVPVGAVTQGGAIFVNGYASNLQITNNVVQNNGGAYGTIRVGTPDLQPDPSSHNDGIRILGNRVIANAGTNLAGGIGLFAGSNGYEVARNDICGNFSAEYGGGITAMGLSPGGRIHHNRIYFNRSYDEGGGIMVAGALPANPAALSPGSGPVDIHANLIQANLANDDGGGIRFLMAGNFPINVFNNFIVNNVSTHEGGGVALNDAPAVRFFNNTVMKNLTTATAVTSSGFPAPAGLSTSANSLPLQATLPGAPTFSNPVLFNNVFWDNRAGTRAGGTVTGLGIPGDATPVYHWDLGVADGTGLLSPTNSVLQATLGTISSPTNVIADPGVIAPYDVSVTFNAWRNNPAFRGAILVAVDLPPNRMGDYHLPATGSPAMNAGAASKTVGALTVAAPATDVDDNPRPQGGGYDIGADEVGTGTGGGGGPPPAAFPTTPVLDTFTRTGILAAPLGASWSGAWNSQAASLIYYLVPRVGGNANQAMVVAGGNAWWSAASFGPNQEAYFTFRNVSGTAGAEQGVLLKVAGTAGSGNAFSAIEVARVGAAVQVRTHEVGQAAWVTRASFPATFAAGDNLGARATTDGTVSVYRNGVLVGSTNVTTGAAPWPTALAQGGGWIGIRFASATGARLDDFGGGTMP